MGIELDKDTQTRAWSESTDWVRRYQCGDAAALVTLQARTQVPGTAISGAGMLLLTGETDKSVLIDALARSPYSAAEKAIGLRAVAQMLNNNLETARKEMSDQESDAEGHQESMAQAVLEPQRMHLHAALGWALVSGDPELVTAAQDLLAMLGDEPAQHERGRRLVECANDSSVEPATCLDSSEHRSGNLQAISAFWPMANAGQRQALTYWANRDGDTKEFLLDQITQVDPRTQYTILEMLDNSRGTAARLRAAQAVLNQALTDPRRRPLRAQLKYLPIFSTGELNDLDLEGIAYDPAQHEAFDELTTYPDVYGLMRGLSELDHPYLATYAAFWLFAHSYVDEARYAMRFASKDGVPNAWFVTTMGHDALAADVALIRTLIERGSSGALAKVESDQYAKALEDPDIRAAAHARLLRLPEYARLARLDLRANASLAQRVENNVAFQLEATAHDQLSRALASDHPEAILPVAEYFASQREEFWQLIAMSLWSLADDPRALDMADKLAKHRVEIFRDAAALTIEAFGALSRFVWIRSCREVVDPARFVPWKSSSLKPWV